MIVEDIIRELDTWMQHYLDWARDKDSDQALMKRKAEACEKARNILAETFGEPTS